MVRKIYCVVLNIDGGGVQPSLINSMHELDYIPWRYSCESVELKVFSQQLSPSLIAFCMASSC
jgi:hypothetical protein